MADLEQEKDLEDDEFKINVKPSTSRSMTTRICNKNAVYQYEEDESESDDQNESLDDEQSDTEDEESNGYSSPDIDYDLL